MSPLRVLLPFLLALSLSAKLDCKNGGVLMLARTRAQPFSLDYKCLCPFNYFGSDCNQYRGSLCYIDSPHSKYNPLNSDEAQLQFDIQCFLKKLYVGDDGRLKQSDQSHQLPLAKGAAEQDYKSNNYYIDSAYQFIWSNDSSMFDDEGRLIRDDENDTRTDQEILDDEPEFKFSYPSQFLGVPLFNSKVIYTLRNVKFLNQSTELGEVKVELTPKAPPSKKMAAKLTAIVRPDWFQYQVAILEARIFEKYGPDQRVVHGTGMNSAKWRIYDPSYERGRQLGPSRQIPSFVWVILATCLIAGGILGSKFAVKVYSRWRNRELVEELQRAE